MYSFNLLYSFKQNSENRLASQDDWSCTAWWADLLGTKRIWKGGNPKIIQGKICGVFWPSFLAEWSFQFNVFTRLPHFKSRWLPSWPLFSLTFCQAQFQLASIAKQSWVSTIIALYPTTQPDPTQPNRESIQTPLAILSGGWNLSGNLTHLKIRDRSFRTYLKRQVTWKRCQNTCPAHTWPDNWHDSLWVKKFREK